MLVLGPDQLDALDRHMMKKLQERLQQVIAATFPELSGASDEPQRLRRIVERGVQNAGRYGIYDAPDLAAFIALGLAWRDLPPGTSADWITRWLERADTPGATKLAVIEAQLAGSGNPALAPLTERVKRARSEAGAP